MDKDISKLVANRVGELLGPLEIAKELKVPTAKAIQYLFIAIGEGLIRQSDLFFILSKKYGKEAGWLIGRSDLQPRKAHGLFSHYVESKEWPSTFDPDELMLYVSYGNRRVYVGDMYVFLTELERTLHERVEAILKVAFGRAEAGWWKQGVPESVRVKCAEARERDDEFTAHSYSFTTLIHIKQIIQANARLFSARLPVSVSKDMKTFCREMDRLNRIRNQVMHPVREEPPTEADFEFVRDMHRKLDGKLWR